MCMIPRPFQIQLEQENLDFCLHLGLRLAFALLKGLKKNKKKHNNQMAEVNAWGGGRRDGY